ncbi:hypothetical protein L596_004236 [Steinernema carpocapsae]|uniref:Secreted protein n=1 Tax=Steinernema carpocapsae TaxID=34508 RepID=A0A4U8UYP5_STECR|nr:hypothetical protein L596_004236 [Steinernema carpocapsae]
MFVRITALLVAVLVSPFFKDVIKGSNLSRSRMELSTTGFWEIHTWTVATISSKLGSIRGTHSREPFLSKTTWPILSADRPQ